MNIKKIEELENTIKQAKQDIDKLNQNIKETEKEIEELQQLQGRWKPKLGEAYYVIGDSGIIFVAVWDNRKIDYGRWGMGNCFKTPEDANFMRERLKVIAELQEFAEPKNREWDMNNRHYCLSYSYIADGIAHEVKQCHRPDEIYFETEEDLYKAVEYVGENRIKRYYLRVENEKE